MSRRRVIELEIELTDVETERDYLRAQVEKLIRNLFAEETNG